MPAEPPDQPSEPVAAAARPPHDGFFVRIVSELESGMALLAERLPAEQVAAIVPGSLERVDASFISGTLRRRYADVLFRVRLSTGGGERDAFAFVLFEHKSAPDGRTALQLLVYKAHIWERWMDQGHGAPLPAVMAIVVHQGPPAWSHGTTFGAIFEPVPPELQSTVPDFTFVLLDLFREPDETLSQNKRLRAGLMAMKYARRPDLAMHLVAILRTIVHLPKLDIEEFLTYLERSPARVAPAVIIDALARLVREGEEDVMGVLEILEEQGMAKGLERGLAKGLERGRAEGQTQALMTLLRQRFGPLPAPAEARIAGGSADDLTRWLHQVLDATSLDDALKS